MPIRAQQMVGVFLPPANELPAGGAALLREGAELQAVAWYDTPRRIRTIRMHRRRGAGVSRPTTKWMVGPLAVAVPAGGASSTFHPAKEQQQVRTRDLHQGTGEARLDRVR